MEVQYSTSAPIGVAPSRSYIYDKKFIQPMKNRMWHEVDTPKVLGANSNAIYFQNQEGWCRDST